MRRGLAVDGGAHGENDLRHLRRLGAGEKGGDVQILRADAVQRREQPAENMITPFVAQRALERPQIGDLLDDADDAAIALRVGTDGAGVLTVEVAARTAWLDRFRRAFERLQHRHQ